MIVDTGLQFLHSSYMPSCDARVDKYFEGYCSVQFMERGEVEVCYDTTCHSIGGPHFWSAFPGPYIRFHTGPGQTWVHRYVAFQGPRADLWRAQGLLLTSPQPAPPARDYPARFDELLSLAQRSDRWGVARAVNALEGLLLELAEARIQATAREPWLEDLMKRLNDETIPTPDYERLARHYGMALSTMRRRFRNATGMPLHTYAMESRISTARALLGDTDLPLKAIAQKLGYNDVCYFARQFREIVGSTPGDYRRTRQGNVSKIPGTQSGFKGRTRKP